MDRFDPFVKYADVYGDVINWEKDPMNKPQNQNKYFFSDGKTYYEQICKMLRLMSVFKQAFNQIYDNEDEIHSAWENFVDNLSATAVYGEEVGVNLTWTDTSVNFAFTIPGGQDGVGIQSITFNSDYTMTITLTDGSTYTSESLRGAQGEQGIQGIQGPAGPQGEPGSGLEILDVYATLQDLQTAHPTGSPGDAYQVGTAPSYTLYIWSASQSGWVSAGTIGSAVPSSADPLMDGTASAGISDLYSRGDHVHPTDTSRASAQDLQTVDDKVDAVDERVDDISDIINTSQKLIDQSFVYRESPAEHDGLAVLDTIKGHTVKFNQLIEDGNFTSVTGWSKSSNESISVSDNILTIEKIASTGQPLQTYKNINTISGHTYLVTADFKADVTENIIMRLGSLTGNPQKNVSSSWTTISGIKTIQDGGSTEFNFYVLNNESSPVGSKVYIKNAMCTDLTAIFGAGSEPATPEAFESWLSQNLGPLSYYDYTTGTLIPFKGTGLKTTGKNLYPKTSLQSQTINGVTLTVNEDGSIATSGTATSSIFMSLGNVTLPKGEYIISCGVSNDQQAYCTLRKANNDQWIANVFGDTVYSVEEDTAIKLALHVINGRTTSNTLYPMIRLASVSDGTYKPYTESTLDLSALNTLFPTGMKDAGSVYDEASETKADTRIGDVDLGTLEWNYNPSYLFFYATVSDGKTDKQTGDDPNTNCALYNNALVMTGQSIGTAPDKIVTWGRNASTVIIKDSSYTDPTAFKTAMSGVMLYYELATPTEQDIDLDLSFKAYEGGTEQLLPVNGSTPTTSSLLADMTYFSINDAMDYILAKLDQVPSSITSDINSLKTRMTSAEGNITSLGGRMTTAEGNITSLTGRMTTAEGNISSNASDISDLQTSLDTLEGRVDSIETDYLKVVQRTLTIGNISAGGNSQGSMPVQSETGYDMIGIIGSKTVRGTFDSNYTVETGFRVVLSGTTNYVYYKIFNLNTSSAAENVELTVDILCKKQSN